MLIAPRAGVAGFIISVAAIACLAMGQGSHAATRYVNAALVTGANDGSSWANAYQGAGGLATAITAAGIGDEVWAAAGLYKPTTTLTRTISFTLKNGVGIYGGFIGNETLLSQRNFVTNVTTLTGDLNGDDPNVADNSFHVVNGGSQNATAILDGFTITGGNANGANPNDRGGGMLMTASSSGTIRNCIVINNRCTFGGGAGYINASSPAFTNCVFQSNNGASFGGAFDMATNCATTFSQCSFLNNTAARAGAVEAFSGCTPVLVNCVFRGNSATGGNGGGAMFLSGSTATLRNCTLAGNNATVTGPAIQSGTSTCTMTNCIVWGNTGPGASLAGTTYNVAYSDVTGGFAGTGNVGGDPMFIFLSAGNLKLGPGSVAIDSANNSLVPGGVTIDRDGLPRFADDTFTADTGVGPAPIVDMGAYEVQIGAPPPPVNDACALANTVFAGSYNFTTVGATLDGPPEAPGCSSNAFLQLENDIWYRYGAQCTGTATVSLCGATFDAKLAIYANPCPTGPGQTIACNDDFCGASPQVSFPVVSGMLYRVRIGGGLGGGGTSGTGTMVITCAVPQPCPADIAPPPSGNGAVNVDDLLAVINSWGACPLPCRPRCTADIAPPPNGNCFVNVDDLLAVINAWGACP